MLDLNEKFLDDVKLPADRIDDDELNFAMAFAELSEKDDDVQTDKLGLPESTEPEEEKRFRAFITKVLSLGGNPIGKRFVADTRSEERGLLALATIDDTSRIAAEAFMEDKAELANRDSDLPDGTYLFAQNGKPEITVYGGDIAEKLARRHIVHIFRTANKLEEVE